MHDYLKTIVLSLVGTKVSFVVMLVLNVLRIKRIENNKNPIQSDLSGVLLF
jgi:hypothetical protein